MAGRLLVFLILSYVLAAKSQTVYVADQFDPAGVGGSSYSNGQIGNVWGNWFGDAFQSVTWDSTSDASNNPASGSMKITADFDGQGSIPNQFEVYDGNSGINPPLSGLLYTNFQCDVRFDPASATTTNGGVVSFGHLQFGVITSSSGQDYFGSIDVPITDTGWVHVSLPIDATADTNLLQITDVLIHIYGPAYSPGLSGTSTLWVDNIKFTGALPVTTNCVVDWNNVHQRIDGFGASSAYNGTWSTAEADLLFSTNNNITYQSATYNGIGLSLLRNHIIWANTTSASDTPSTAETSIMKLAQARGARVWSTPWTPAVGFKSTNDIYDAKPITNGVNGGTFLGSGNNITNLNYASQLANYVVAMKNQGINLYALSVQNEPDASVNTYDACQWTGAQIHDFTTNLFNALAAKGVGSTKIMLPESENWTDPHNLAGSAMGDPGVAADVGIIACHNYDGANGPANLVKNNFGKALWETEVSQLGGETSDIANGLYYAQRIFLFMTVAQANAWHYWWIVPFGSETGLMTQNAGTTKRMFTIGNYSRFVRPGYYRINVSNNNPLALISAYKDPVSGNYAIVAVNPNSIPATQIFDLTNFPAVGSVTPWITSGTLSLASQSAVPVVNASFTYTLPPLSVVTFVGQAAANTAPTLAPITDQTINAGQTLLLTNIATDSDVPPQTLTFGAANVFPANATLDSASGIFSWRPLVSQGGTTHLISVQVTDDGLPPLSATNNFHVIVNPIIPPVLSSVTVTAGQVRLTVNGMVGPDYTLQTSTNLLDWQTLFTTNSPTLPLTLMDTHFNDTLRFYRIQIGP